MKKIIYAALLTGSVLLVSYRSGAIPWMLFYFMLMLPILALLYVQYVYFRFRIVQQVDRYVDKGVPIPYRLKLANEDWLMMSGISLNFYTDTVSVTKRKNDGVPVSYAHEPDRLFLLPHQQQKVDLELSCKYRGTYPVGVKSVSITDFFGLFTITYPMMAQIRLTARPRILTLGQLQSKLSKWDPKKAPPSSSLVQEQLDYELRKYIQGDALRSVHWKNSARAGELLVRKQAPQELFELIIIMDCTLFPEEAELKRMQIEDNIIEAALALLYDACLQKVRARVVWCSDKIREIMIDNMKSFDIFYNLCAELTFCSCMTLEEVWKSYQAKANENAAFWLVGCHVPPPLLKQVQENCKAGKKITVIDTGTEPL